MNNVGYGMVDGCREGTITVGDLVFRVGEGASGIELGSSDGKEEGKQEGRCEDDIDIEPSGRIDGCPEGIITGIGMMEGAIVIEETGSLEGGCVTVV